MEPQTVSSSTVLTIEPVVALLLSFTLSILIYVLSALIANWLYTDKRKRLQQDRQAQERRTTEQLKETQKGVTDEKTGNNVRE